MKHGQAKSGNKICLHLPVLHQNDCASSHAKMYRGTIMCFISRKNIRECELYFFL